MSPSRRPRPAHQAWEEQGSLTWAFLQRYAAHRPFCDALLRLAVDHCAGPSPLRDALAARSSIWEVFWATWDDGPLRASAGAYLRDLRALAEAFGLDRIGAPSRVPTTPEHFEPSTGERWLHTWCCGRAARGAAARPESFWMVVGFGGARPAVGDVVAVEEFLVEGPGGERVVVRDEHRRPRVVVRLDEVWDPRHEPQPQARTRLQEAATRQIDAGLDRIAADAEARGYTFRDTTPKRGQHLGWLFEHVALKRSYGAIAAEHLGGWDLVPSVYNRIRPLAQTIGIRLGRVPRS